MDDFLVRADNAAKVYGAGDCAVTALAAASFDIAARSRIALVGPSGSGKTTLLHLAAGLDLPTSGAVRWPAIGSREHLRPRFVGMAFQGPSLLVPLTVVENVAFPLLIAGEREPEALEKAWWMLDRMALADVGTKFPEEISGGQSQRAGLARALVIRPALMLADEPTGQQDSESSRALMSAILDYVEDIGCAVVVATHDPAIAGLLETRWSIEDGRLETG